MLCEHILAEKQNIEAQLKTLQRKLEQFPAGKLLITRNDNRYKWYRSDGKHHTYIPKKDRQLAEQLAAKKYLSLRCSELLHEKKAIEYYLRHHSPAYGQAEQLLTNNPPFQELLSSFFQPSSQKLSHWMQEPYTQNPSYPEQRIHKTSSGNLVRSKSEALIDMILYINKIPFRYEWPYSLIPRSYTLILPFAIQKQVRPITGSISV